MATLKVKVVPSSSRNAVVGWLGGVLKVKVAAPPEKGKANAAVIELLAATLDIDKRSIEIISGKASPLKVLSIDGLGYAQIAAALKGEAG